MDVINYDSRMVRANHLLAIDQTVLESMCNWTQNLNAAQQSLLESIKRKANIPI